MIDWEEIATGDLVSRACNRRAAALDRTPEADMWERCADAAYELDAADVARVLREQLDSDYDGLCTYHLQGPGSVLDDDGVLDALAAVIDARVLRGPVCAQPALAADSEVA